MSTRRWTLDGWRRSDEFRALCRRQAAKMNAEHRLRPRCGAMARTTGEPCRQPALASGRCRWHGGATPKGKDWHRLRLPTKDVPGALDKINRKIADKAKAARRREKRLAKMTSEERAAHDRWQKAHRPGDPKKRAAARERRRQDLETAARIAAWETEPPRNPEIAAIDAEIAELRQRLAAAKLERETSELEIFS